MPCMQRRKIQLIAGTTYSVSLPKDWVKKSNLDVHDEVVLEEKNDRTLVISGSSIKQKKFNEISINVDEYAHNIDQILFAIYYLGIENINLFSKKELTKDVRSRIRKTLTHMSGTEISYEDKQKIAIKVLLDKSKINLAQILYRISLIIELTICNLTDKLDISEVRINENEIDRLYHLTSKIISLSLIDANILNSSRIRNVSLIPSYFLIAKKLENIGDNLNHLAEHIRRRKPMFEGKKEILNFIKNQINMATKHIIQAFPKDYEKSNPTRINNYISKIKDDVVKDYLKETVRYVADIQGEIVNMSFYTKLIKDNSL